MGNFKSTCSSAASRWHPRSSALGSLSRLRPDTSLVRYAVNLTRRPGTVAQRGQLAADLAGIVTGSSAITPQRRDRRFADPAWSENPLLRRAVQAYLAMGRTAEELLADAELDWRDNERLKFMLTNLIAASAPSNNPLLSPAAWKAFIDRSVRARWAAPTTRRSIRAR